jgi:16S rRNA (guanine1516-N2)-methyltransferase
LSASLFVSLLFVNSAFLNYYLFTDLPTGYSLIALLPDTPAQLLRTEALAEELGLPLYAPELPMEVVMVVGASQCWLRRLTPPVLNWTIDFTSPAYQSSFAQRTVHNDPLARAIGLHKKSDLRVLDMTAGLGKDALWLARCGAQVTLVERNPALAYLLSEAVKAIDLPMKVICMDAKTYLSSLPSSQFDIAYYDPMFTPRTKTALVKKDMQILQALHGEEPPDPELISLAKSLIPKVVVKRAYADPVLLVGVHHQLKTKVTRFDIY